MEFRLDPRIAASSHLIAELDLCQARLQDDARFPWIVLVPRQAGAVEIADLEPADQDQLWREMQAAGRAVHALLEAGGSDGKLNYGQLGNVVAQLHVHVVGRRPGDAAWPGPVWGAGVAEPYGDAALAEVIEEGRRAFNL